MPSIKMIRGQYGSFAKGSVAEVSAKTADYLIAKKMAVLIGNDDKSIPVTPEDKLSQYETLKSELKAIKTNAALATFAETNQLVFEKDNSTIAEKAEKLLVQLEVSFFDGGR